MSEGYLLDTHSLLWAIYAPDMLPSRVRDLLQRRDEPIYASAISAFEIAQKHRLGRLDFARAHALDFTDEIAKDNLESLPLTADHARLAGALPIPHRDPFDRMLIAQAQIEELALISNEAMFDQFGVVRFW
ncbi:MAG: type II toxin-antitoxin system VapC family toxin [Sphingopyxis sp.]|uniref:type II toxin-antitoxin system VapC family toxin n=1 Tax=Sphingopyxis sp. TaxID=1908224 RepID=UPI003D6C74B9